MTPRFALVPLFALAALVACSATEQTNSGPTEPKSLASSFPDTPAAPASVASKPTPAASSAAPAVASAAPAEPVLNTLAIAVLACPKKAEIEPETAPTFSLVAHAAPTATPRPPPPPAPLLSVDEEGKQTLAMFATINKAVQTSKGDCTKLAASLVPAKSAMEKLSAGTRGGHGDPVRGKALDDKYGERIRSAGKEALCGLVVCKDNADIQAFFAAMD